MSSRSKVSRHTLHAECVCARVFVIHSQAARPTAQSFYWLNRKDRINQRGIDSSRRASPACSPSASHNKTVSAAQPACLYSYAIYAICMVMDRAISRNCNPRQLHAQLRPRQSLAAPARCFGCRVGSHCGTGRYFDLCDVTQTDNTRGPEQTHPEGNCQVGVHTDACSLCSARVWENLQTTSLHFQTSFVIFCAEAC